MLNLKWLANGCEPKRLLLPPPLPSRVMVIANARQRGWTLQQIGISASVTFQAVEQFLFRYERFHGEVHPAPRHRFSYAPQISFECATCGARSWKTASDLTLKYCSRKCHGIDKRILTDDEILWAIDRRVQTGDTWTGLSNILKRDVQLIQRSIWIKLAEEGNLTKRIVSRIWQPSQSLFVKRGRWDWLIGLTGLEPRAE